MHGSLGARVPASLRAAMAVYRMQNAGIVASREARSQIIDCGLQIREVHFEISWEEHV